MTTEFAKVYLLAVVGLVAAAFAILMMVVVTRKRKHLSPLLAFRGYVMFGVVLVVGVLMMATPFRKGYTVSDIFSGGPSVGEDDGRQENRSDDDAERRNDDPIGKHAESAPRPSLPEMSGAEARFLVRNLESRSRLLRLNAIERLSRSRPRERDRQRIVRALEPLTRDLDNDVRNAARRALASLRR